NAPESGSGRMEAWTSVAGQAWDWPSAASQPEASAWLLRQLPSMPPKAWRWVAEMEEIGAFFESVGVPGGTLRGAAETYRKVADTPLGRETPETRDKARDGRAVAEGLATTLS
ncbi:MAG: DUF1932 domain-containing protein, partial [Acetobacteraceae bacterium]